MIIEFLLTILIVGIVTAGLKIRFDRFFTILLLLFVFGLTVFDAINIFLWVIMFGALMIILENKGKISKLPKNMKIKLFVLVPFSTLIASLVGSYFFVISTNAVLIITLGILAILYGLRLIFIHFKIHEYDLQNANLIIKKACGLFGPILSGVFIGFVGTSLKPLKIPFAVKIGKLNMKQVYIGNAIATFFASLFAIMWHFILIPESVNIFYVQLLLGAALWTGIHYTFEITNLIFKDKWRKGFQIIIGFILILASVKIFMLI